MSLLRRRAQVLPLMDLIRRLASPEPLAGDIAAITFDDGYRDNLETALPILQRHGLPATVFITTDFIDRRQVPLADRVWQAFGALWRREIGADRWHDSEEPGFDQEVRKALRIPGTLKPLRDLGQRLLRSPWDRVEAFLNRLDEFAGAPTSGQSRMLDWEGVRKLESHAIEIGSHTLSHPVLSRIPRERAREELLGSKARIEQEIQKEVRGFAFPIGRVEDFTEDDLKMLPEAGYQYACTTVRGPNLKGMDPYRILRIGVGDYEPSILDLKLALGR